MDDLGSVVRVRAEHSASFISPPKPTHSTTELDLEGATAAPLHPSPGGTRFSFANSVHAEVRLPNEQDLIALVGRLLQERAQRSITVASVEVLSYVEARLTARDPEWLAVIAPNGKEQGEWGKAIATFRRRKAGASNEP